MKDNDVKQLSVYVVWGGGKYGQVKTQIAPRIRKEMQRVVQYTKLG